MARGQMTYSDSTEASVFSSATALANRVGIQTGAAALGIFPV